MAATTKTELLAVTEKEFEKLSGLIGDIESATAESKDGDDTSIKDVIAHRAHWIDLFLGWYKDGQAGREVFFPAEGYKWNDLKRYNADLRATQSSVTWDESRKAFLKAHRRLAKFVTSLSEDDLYGGPMAGANNKWTPGRWAEAAGPSHYRSAGKYVRAQLRNLNEG